MKRFAALALSTLALTLPARNEPSQPATKLIVFVNRSTPVNKMSSSQLQEVLLGQLPQWSNGRPVTILLVDDQSLSRTLKVILKMTKSDYVAHFLTGQYRDSQLIRPRLVPNQDAALQFLTSHPGTISVLEGEPDMTVAGAKAIRIDGKLPDEDGYRY